MLYQASGLEHKKSGLEIENPLVLAQTMPNRIQSDKDLDTDSLLSKDSSA